MKKTILAYLMAGAMAVTFVSCDTSKDSGSNSESTKVVMTEIETKAGTTGATTVFTTEVKTTEAETTTATEIKAERL